MTNYFKFKILALGLTLATISIPALAMGERVDNPKSLTEKREDLRSKCVALSAKDKQYKYVEGRVEAVQLSVIPCLPEVGKSGCQNLLASLRFILSDHEVSYAVLPGTQPELKKLNFPENKIYGFCGTLQKDQANRSTLKVTKQTLAVLE